MRLQILGRIKMEIFLAFVIFCIIVLGWALISVIKSRNGY